MRDIAHTNAERKINGRSYRYSHTTPAGDEVLKPISLPGNFRHNIHSPASVTANQQVLKTAQQVTSRTLTTVKQAWSAIQEITGASWESLFSNLKTLSGNSQVVTWSMLATGLITGAAAIKTSLKSITTWNNDMRDIVPWAAYLGQAVLYLGCSAGILAPFLGKTSFLSENIDGKPILTLPKALAAVAAPLFAGECFKLAQKRSLLGKFPILGPLLEDIAASVFGGAKSFLSVNPPKNQGNSAGQGMPMAA